MADPNKQAKRRRLLKERQAAERRKADRAEANYCWGLGKRALDTGDPEGALRMLKKALALDPAHCPALELAGKVYYQAGRYPEAAYYYGQWRKRQPHPVAHYDCGLAHMKMGRHEEAAEDFGKCAAAVDGLGESQWAALRADALRWQAHATQLAQAAPAPPQLSLLARPAGTPVATAKTPEPPGEAGMPVPTVTVTFLAAPEPDFPNDAKGALTDYLLRRRLHELRLAQSFEDLVCLGSLHGVDSYVHQHETVRKVLRQFKGRALLADEVGLGKTIEACLALKEYWTRGMVRRALVLAPPALVSQWKGELTEKFGFAPVSPDGPEFRRSPEQFWKEQPLVVTSIALARLEPHASLLASAPWDLVIVDEAHCLKNRASANWRLLNSLQKKFLLMLTATPVENNLLELYNLITVLKPGLLSTEAEFRKSFVTSGRPKHPKNPERLRALLAEVMVRNTRSAVDVRLPPRMATSVVVPPSPQEAELYEMVSRFVGDRYRPGEQSLALGWLQRQAGSSPQALCRATGRALAEGSRLGAPDRRELEGIQELAAQLRDSGKGRRLGEMLAGRAGKVVVFTEFVSTLEYLAGVAESHGIRYALFRGDMSRPQKDGAIARFRDEAEVLLSTGSGGEGRNLQFADTVLNFDLPWNPMRLEQRVGRVHRIGQTREVFIFNFCQGGTIEEHLLRVLHDKINMFELVVGEMDVILGTLDESGDFADLVLELWVSARDPERRAQAFEELAERLLAAKQHYARTRELEDALFQHDFEV